jgi:hypothetical protein
VTKWGISAAIQGANWTNTKEKEKSPIHDNVGCWYRVEREQLRATWKRLRKEREPIGRYYVHPKPVRGQCQSEARSWPTTAWSESSSKSCLHWQEQS